MDTRFLKLRQGKARWMRRAIEARGVTKTSAVAIIHRPFETPCDPAGDQALMGMNAI
ncbi:MAG: hypothetical protein QM749_11030 [Aquabacterium sp.]